MNGTIRGDYTTKDGRAVRVVDRFHGPDAEHNAWAAADRAARLLKTAGVVKRYGVTAHRRMVILGARRRWEWRLVLVDRTPEKGNAPAVVDRMTSKERSAAACR